jgi:hypothetical protein
VTKAGSYPVLHIVTVGERLFGDLNDIIFSLLNGKFYHVMALMSRAFLLEAMQPSRGVSRLRPPFDRGNGFFPIVFLAGI